MLRIKKINIIDPNLCSLNFYNYKFYDSLKNYNNIRIFGNLKINKNIGKKNHINKIFNLGLNPRLNSKYIKTFYYLKYKFIKYLQKIDFGDEPILLYNTTLPYVYSIIEWLLKENVKNKIYIEHPTVLYKATNPNLKFEKKICEEIKKKIKFKKNIYFISHFKYANSRISKLFGKKPQMCSIPFKKENYVQNKNKIKKKKIVVGFVGEQREAKGLNMIYDIATKLDKNIKVIIHNPTNNIKVSKAKFNKFKNIKVIKKNFELKSWIIFLSKIDFIVFPYNMHRYKFSYSSTLVDSILLNKICIVPDKTSLSSIFFKKLLKFTSFKICKPSHILKSINNSIINYNLINLIVKKQRINFLKIQKKYPSIIKIISNGIKN